MDNKKYDSKDDTLKHIMRVRELLGIATDEITNRGLEHDASKLGNIEKPYFDEHTPKLANLTYGSVEYEQSLKELRIALDNHYANNSHHPEHHNNGINDMNIFDIIEMFFDWKSATERHETGNIYESIEHNKTRFDISDQLCNIFINTAKYMKWDK